MAKLDRFSSFNLPPKSHPSAPSSFSLRLPAVSVSPRDSSASSCAQARTLRAGAAGAPARRPPAPLCAARHGCCTGAPRIPTGSRPVNPGSLRMLGGTSHAKHPLPLATPCRSLLCKRCPKPKPLGCHGQPPAPSPDPSHRSCLDERCREELLERAAPGQGEEVGGTAATPRLPTRVPLVPPHPLSDTAPAAAPSPAEHRALQGFWAKPGLCFPEFSLPQSVLSAKFWAKISAPG